ncbi:F0F1 ATP synthase subunit delta [Ectobacillus antri]|jgi:F-type H+-transporting ATPase subunit delta|uniref:ATP synthase subunit delta n=1 Tax=Ectobacillus antri TaxID=2486280 RepID=A0ABT6HAR7_9BACI|nr:MULTISPECIES: F0F1 ATP synthase subunit delta [Ectobacillus]MDG4658509.1 F0F1 ATP synthase subunit delta [Ectobacillus antri]MDG5755621.1 F0F1 ATP synthase subunit delta [Ectobacillus antri]UOY91205.1 F0F1 ATP synthase subunit delta [Ectobacillus sp. JY-23]
MSKDIVASRYAVALFKLAKEKHMLETFEEELRTVKEVFQNTKELHMFLEQPNISNEKKKDMLKTVFSSLSQPMLNTLCLLVDKQREDIVTDIADAYFELANAERNIADATVYSVRPLTEDEKAGIAEVFAKRDGKDAIRIKNVVNTELLGGIKVRIGNRIYDGSLQGKLARIQRELLKNR